jgi:hypothetical protein
MMEYPADKGRRRKYIWPNMNSAEVPNVAYFGEPE